MCNIACVPIIDVLHNIWMKIGLIVFEQHSSLKPKVLKAMNHFHKRYFVAGFIVTHRAQWKKCIQTLYSKKHGASGAEKYGVLPRDPKSQSKRKVRLGVARFFRSKSSRSIQGDYFSSPSLPFSNMWLKVVNYLLFSVTSLPPATSINSTFPATMTFISKSPLLNSEEFQKIK